MQQAAARLVRVCLVAVLLLIVRVHGQCNGSRTYQDYKVSWTSYAGEVRFTASVPTDNGTWLALGISSDDKMALSDIVIGSINDNGDYFVEDRWASSASTPDYDDIQNIYKTSMDVYDGTMEMSFSRQIFVTQQPQDFTLGKACRRMLVAWGGTVTGYTSPASFTKHTDAQVLPQFICLQDCKDGVAPTTTSSIMSSTTMSTMGPQETGSSSGFSLSTGNIAIIAGSVVGFLILFALVLVFVLVCVCICTRQSSKAMAVYELDSAANAAQLRSSSTTAAAQLHPTVRRETMSKEPDIGTTLTLPVNEYQTETLGGDQVLYDMVAPDEPTLRRAPPGGPPNPYIGGQQQNAAQPTLRFEDTSVKSTVVFHNSKPEDDVTNIYDPVQPMGPPVTDQQYEPVQQQYEPIQNQPFIPVPHQQYEHMEYDPSLAV